ncbi:phospholipase B1, membrane-associated-like [Anopheles cruzii]|uniref:phospholipase B1, membrane-associated-like n=1 Tax=Anopheles cruzii TaxID=68878 RepID=UPI0022EC4628|nr:phospholipase B1, membrane-associated-like [Anopheles cruzii]
MTIITLLAILVGILSCGPTIGRTQDQITFLDGPPFLALYRELHGLLFNFVGPNSANPDRLNRARSLGKIQTRIPSDQSFPCATQGMRSPQPPTSVHELRPGDIDVIASMGDSLTAGTGVLATGILELVIENRGLSWSIGGQGTWREYLTVPNILKMFNPNLNGYVVADSLSIDKASRFDVAEIGGMSADLPHQARNLIKRMLGDRNVDMKNHWKLITILIGHNDFCSRVCYLPRPEKALYYHEQNLITALRLLKKYLPRTMVNIVAAINVNVLRTFRPRPSQCVTTHLAECSCIFGSTFKDLQPRLNRIMNEWNRVEERVASLLEFQNVTDFTVNYQSFPERIRLPSLPNGDTDASFASVDCFHFSQRGHAIAANSYWNNMLEPLGNKSELVQREFERFSCPTLDRPYLATLRNSLPSN